MNEVDEEVFAIWVEAEIVDFEAEVKEETLPDLLADWADWLRDGGEAESMVCGTWDQLNGVLSIKGRERFPPRFFKLLAGKKIMEIWRGKGITI